MRTRMFRNWKLVLVLIGLPFVGGSLERPRLSDLCAQESVSIDPSGAPPANTNNQTATPPAGPASPAETVNLPGGPPPTAPQIKLSAGVAEIAKLGQSGVGEDVMLAYIGNIKSCFNLGSDQIVYLNDLGVSGAVVRAMIQRDAAITADSLAAVQAANANPSSSTSGTNPFSPPTTDSFPPPSTVDTPVADDLAGVPDYPGYLPGDYADNEDSGFFYNALAPYGSWIYLSGYGVCWQPTVCVGNHNWKPYCDRGHWLYTDCGWYWHSNYSWGWAPFHYGRWFCDGHRGWIWAPDRIWGSAWVTWRHSAEHIGWAPLPPSARFISGVGFRHWSIPRGAGAEFALQPVHYTFIPTERLGDYTPHRYALPVEQLNKTYNQSTVLNNITLDHNKIVNRGIDPNEVTAVSGIEVRRAEVRDLPSQNGNFTQADQLTRSGNTLVIYRAQSSSSASHEKGFGSAASSVTPAPLRRNSDAFVGSQKSLPQTPARPETEVARSIAITAPNKQEPAESARRPLPMMNLALAASSPNGSGAQVAGRESYPPGSLVITGNKNDNGVQSQPYAPLPNMNLAHQPLVPSLAYQISQPAIAYPQAGDNESRTLTATGEIQPGPPAYWQSSSTLQPGGWQPPNRAYQQTGQVRSPQIVVIPSRYTAAQVLANHPRFNRAPEQAPWQTSSTPAAAPAPAARSVSVESPRAMVEHSAPVPVPHSAPSSSGSSASSGKK